MTEPKAKPPILSTSQSAAFAKIGRMLSVAQRYMGKQASVRRLEVFLFIATEEPVFLQDIINRLAGNPATLWADLEVMSRYDEAGGEGIGLILSRPTHDLSRDRYRLSTKGRRMVRDLLRPLE